MKTVTESVDFGGRSLTFEVGRVANQASSSVLVSYGDTTILATVVVGDVNESIDYFPLIVEYAERLYAGGRIKGSRWVKREGRPSDDAILTARLIDRSIRPLFPKDYKNQLQVIITVLSVDGENEPDILGIIGASAALALAPVPWKGPIGAARMGFVTPVRGEDHHFVINPSGTLLDESVMNLVVSATANKVHMIEAGAAQVSEDVMLQAITAAKQEAQTVIGAIEKLVKAVGVPTITQPTDTEDQVLRSAVGKRKNIVQKLLTQRATKEGSADMSVLIDEVSQEVGEEFSQKQIVAAIEAVTRDIAREAIIKQDKRPDGRGLSEIRPITAEVSVLPRTHGSALFSRGDTQALTVATLAGPALEQLIESPTGEESKRYMHHYNMPPYSVGEVGRFGFPRRREIGHGALAERALEYVIPSEKEFPYTIRLVSEIMSSNGSTSMASVCGSTLALMDAGVPIKTPIAGISIGLVVSDQTYKLLTDIIGLEDFYGDMDFKVAGSKDGITAIQLDVKIDGLTDEMIAESLAAARSARRAILEKMAGVMKQARNAVSQYAPKIRVMQIPTDKIGEVIGPGGRMIRRIIAETETSIDVNDEGVVTITGVDSQLVDRAHEWINGLTREIEAGEVFEGKVTRIFPFGVMVETLPGREGLLHVSKMSTGFVRDPGDLFSIDQTVKVRVQEIDDMGRVNLVLADGPLPGGDDRPAQREAYRRSPRRRRDNRR